MNHPSVLAQGPATALAAGWRQVTLYMELGKVRLSAMVVVTAAVGYLLACPGPVDWLVLVQVMVGTGLSAFSANAWNQYLERDRDAKMHRTADRPLPSGRLSGPAAMGFALACAAAGLAVLARTGGPMPALLAGANIAWYLAVYTPLKTRSTLNTLAGAVVGAVPPLIGWSAARGGLDGQATALAGVLFVWQVPHFLALAWLYREDYRRGGYRMLPAMDPGGRLVGALACLWAAALVPLSLTIRPAAGGSAGYVMSATVLGAAFLAMSVGLFRKVGRKQARRLFIASVVYLPVLLAMMVVGRYAGSDEQGPQMGRRPGMGASWIYPDRPGRFEGPRH